MVLSYYSRWVPLVSYQSYKDICIDRFYIFDQGQLTGTQEAYLFSCWLGTDWEKRHKNIKYLFIHGPVHKIVSWDYSRAGDALLLITDQSTQQMSVILQIDIDKLASWIKTWQMQFNVTWINVMRWGYLIGRRNLRWWILTPMAKSCLLIWELCYLMTQDGILMWKILWSK